MWLSNEMDLPDSLVEAQKEKHLAIFVGAGISMSAPSNLPNFKSLAEKIVGESVPDSTPIDRFLGTAHAEGKPVHQRVQEIIGDPNSHHTLTHQHILSLFASAQDVRVVTTNFDRHFSTAAHEMFGEQLPDIYYAPALPLGRDFSGIVYLHGSVDRPSDTLVCTDVGFGQAYLTDGWARRFLLPLFLEYTVLFIGYSHDDPVMHYIARGLPPNAIPRYAFTEDGRNNHWETLGIIPIPYSLIEGDDPHCRLQEALKAWVDDVRMEPLDREGRIRELVSTVPSPAKAEQDFLRNCLAEETWTGHFCHYASRAPWTFDEARKWLDFAETVPTFVSLFEGNASSSPVSAHLSRWFADVYVSRYPRLGLHLLQQKKQQMGPTLTFDILRVLAYHSENLDQPFLDEWIILLCPKVQALGLSHYFEYLSHALIERKDVIGKGAALAVFECLYKFDLRLEHTWRFSEEESPEASAQLVLHTYAEHHSLRSCWDDFYRPRIPEFFREFVYAIRCELVKGHAVLESFAQANDNYDVVSWGRAAIEPHEQDKYPKDTDVLIDIARDVLEWLVMHKAETARETILDWSESKIPILERLAVHGVRSHPGLCAVDRVEWVLDKNFLFRFACKHEIFELLRTSFPSVSTSLQERLLAAIDARLVEANEALDDRESSLYEVYNLLYWLRQAAPNCTAIAFRLAQIQQQHPEWRGRSHPDLHFWIESGFGGPPSPIPVDTLLEMTPEDLLGAVNNRDGEREHWDYGEGLPGAIEQAAVKDFAWGQRLVSRLLASNDFSHLVWRSVLRSWKAEELDEAQWEYALKTLADHPQLFRMEYEVASLLVDRLVKHSRPVAQSLLELAEQVGHDFFQHLERDTADVETGEFDGWLNRAINSCGGKLAEFWLWGLSCHQELLGDAFKEVPEQYRKVFDQVVSSSTAASQMARVIFARQLHYLHAIDLPWTERVLVPLFDRSRCARTAEQMWGGFLFRGRWTIPLYNKLLPFWEQHIEGLVFPLSREGEGVYQNAAVLAVHGLNNGWLDRLIERSDEKGLEKWAFAIAGTLDNRDDDGIRLIWEQFLRDYWSRRLNGHPRLLTELETVAMMGWMPELEPVFAEAVDLATKTLPFNLLHTSLYYDLKKANMAKKFPEETLRLLLHLLPAAQRPFYHADEVLGIAEQLKQAGISPTDSRALCNCLTNLGIARADKFLTQ